MFDQGRVWNQSISIFEAIRASLAQRTLLRMNCICISVDNINTSIGASNQLASHSLHKKMGETLPIDVCFNRLSTLPVIQIITFMIFIDLIWKILALITFQDS